MRISVPAFVLLLLVTGLTPPAKANLSEAIIDVDGATLRVYLDEGEFALPREDFLDWIRTSAQVVTHYYDKFPVPELYIALIEVPGRGVKNGRALIAERGTINVRVGVGSTREDLRKDWIMVHEMIHFALPRVARQHHWIEEGLAVYVESIARANAGDLAPPFVWHGFVRGMPHGLPKTGDRGLDRTPTWGRTYWGGALFCLLADIEIRKRTGNRKSLRDGLRAIVAENLSMLDRRPLAELFRIADAGIGETVLSELYEQHRAQPVMVDLEAMWQELGVVRGGSSVTLHDETAMHRLREAITARDPAFRSRSQTQ